MADSGDANLTHGLLMQGAEAATMLHTQFAKEISKHTYLELLQYSPPEPKL